LALEASVERVSRPGLASHLHYRPGMNRRRFLLTSLAGAVAVPLAAKAQHAGGRYRIGFLPFSTCSVPEAFRSALNSLGYVEGRNVVIECRPAAGPNEGLSDAATELMRLKIDVLVAQGTPAARAAQRATAVTPIVFVTAGDPVGNGLVTSLARPGKNVTGTAAMDPIQTIKGVEFLKEGASSITRVAVLLDLSNPNHGLQMKEQDAAAHAMGLELRRIDLRRPSDLDAAFTAMIRERTQAVFLFPLRIGRPDTDRIVEFTIKNRLPTLGLVDLQYREAGVLLYYTFNRAEQYARAASFVDRILKGANPAEIPVEQPTKFELVINLKTAKTFSGSCQATFS
jgi:putative tryptophan/tyrosine transport system substrate-binding protein